MDRDAKQKLKTYLVGEMIELSGDLIEEIKCLIEKSKRFDCRGKDRMVN